jgi:hypothetical protein
MWDRASQRLRKQDSQGRCTNSTARLCIGQVARLDRKSVEIDVWKIAAIFLKFLRTVVTSFAQALKWTQPELVHVGSVWRDVIANRCWRNDDSRISDRDRSLSLLRAWRRILAGQCATISNS